MDSIEEKIKYLKEFVKENANFDAFDSELLSLLEAVAREQDTKTKTTIAKGLPDRCFVDMDESYITGMETESVTNTLKELL